MENYKTFLRGVDKNFKNGGTMTVDWKLNIFDKIFQIYLQIE